MSIITDVRIQSITPLISPAALRTQLRLDDDAAQKILGNRQQIDRIISREDPRILGIVGPCSIHDKKAALEYAQRLKGLADRVSDRMLLIMRTYFEKPRTILGWRGLILDPHLDGTYDIAYGLELARDILLQISTLGLPVGCEMLDPIVPQYIDDIVCWAAIGARTTESQTHRNLASGLSVPVGFKNSTSGNLTNAINAVKSAASPASFIGIDTDGNSSILRTTGNDKGHLILRGGSNSPNYYQEYVEEAAAMMEDMDMIPSIIIDCSHANSRKMYTRQKRVLRSVIDQILRGDRSISGFMLESNLNAGNQKLHSDASQLEYGVSITDACIGWDETEQIIMDAYEHLSTKEA
ncbi:MAG: 3-deoxy-7-phosphoheptulonate synthase [Spirochaetia bacterium]|nr:3-deoxy-7-phosphoheptulonate synthase [Spirochaetia bacterium]MCF7941772.1 3-deoxy-7-phosphoheptulonate synthase [Spirochaetia bacterium]